MPTSTIRSLLPRLRILLFPALGLTFGLGLACDQGAEEPCDTLCAEGPFGNVEEIASEDGTLTCGCGSNTPSQNACESYCEDVGGDADNASVVDQSCVCPSLDAEE